MLLFIITPEHESAKLLQCFNTSHVVIYPEYRFGAASIFWFQYISCCYLSKYDYLCLYYKKRVSIHLMLLFISLLKPLSMLLITVSIYLILLFIEAVRGYCRFAFKVSIHLMLLFIVFSSIHSWTEDLFQYISCCYLSYFCQKELITLSEFQYISCCYLSWLIMTQ